ncbi:MAG: homocysteine S-methyltransferase family protein [Lachnospiraceae bacterium]|nr:homocysteine S-methyltransferase family protein [Lachnospiraceae bacterium]MDD5854560.1 homocysteine S-methyltransferase family protein [Lachnospiraceae bacterium]
MTKQEFQQLCRQRIVYLDGATGSNLMKAGMPVGVCPEQWILEHEQALIDLQSAYIDAGTDILYAPTFTANRIKLKEYDLEDQIEEINTRLIKLSKMIARDKALVAADLTMTGKQLKPMGPLDFEELIDIYKEQIQYAEKAGADLIVIETMMSLQETRAAAIAAMEVSKLPVMATLTFESDGRTLFGSDAKSAAITLSHLHVDAIGANCSTGPDQMCKIIEAMAEVTDIPLIAKPNAGLPSLDENGMTVYDMDSDTFSEQMIQIVESGATILGGCCGTSPEYIKKLVDKTKDLPVVARSLAGRRFLSSERQSLTFGLDDCFMIVGERINPTGKKKLQAEIREGKLDLVDQFAAEQEESGAKILDINMGMSGIDEKSMMLTVLDEVANITSLPLSIDSSHVDVIEAALRRYPGRALINSISFEKVKVESLLPIAWKYGAMFILLPLSDEGLPKSLDEKISIINEIVDRALKMGMRKEDIVVDGLVATVAANPLAAKETLQTIRYCKEHDLATICGLSNISFGLPERMNVNSAFLTMAIMEGLTMAIANPNQEMLVNAAFSSDILMAKDGADLQYINRMNAIKEAKEAFLKANPEAAQISGLAVKVKQKSTSTDIGENTSGVQPEGSLGSVKEAVLKGKQRDIIEITKTAVDDGFEPQQILNEALMPAINEVGDLFDKGKYFLPQLIASAETMKKSIDYLEPMLKKDGVDADMPTVVIATVKGDIHDIGKNLVALMLKNHGFTVVDLGKDVPREEIIEAARKYNARIIALSALMTTTMQEMKHVIDLAKQEGIEAKVMIGGAVITQDYADEIGADGYSKDAADAVKLAQKLCE